MFQSETVNIHYIHNKEYQEQPIRSLLNFQKV